MMHLDLNSCFATVEQQANPLLRDKPIAIAAYDSPGGCIIAPSIEAKKLGIKVGMRVKEGKAICPNLVVLLPDPDKYRFVNRKLLALLQKYSHEVYICSIDEMVIDFSSSPYKDLEIIAREIKLRIKKEIGEWLTISVGIAPNRFLAKLASSLEKPNGLVVIDQTNILNILAKLKLTDIAGIKINNCIRLNQQGIFTPLDFYHASVPVLKMAFGGICGYYWYLRLHGFEIDNVEHLRKSYGNSYALYKAEKNNTELAKILCKLVEKMGRRLRRSGYTASGIHISCLFSDYTFWHQGRKTHKVLYTNSDLYKEALKTLLIRPSQQPVRILAVSCFNLVKNLYSQLSFLTDIDKEYKLTRAVDAINERFGEFVVTPARMLGMDEKIIDRIAFGGITELAEAWN